MTIYHDYIIVYNLVKNKTC